MPTALVYAPQYDISLFGLERLHPFDTRKYGRAWAALRGRFGRRLDELHLRPVGPVSDGDLRTVHDDAYLDESLRSSAYLARALEVARCPRWLIDWRVLRPMRWATAGTILAARHALAKGGVAFNLSGGYHHASRSRGEGFSVYADVGVAVAVLRRDELLGESDRVLYIDLDAHQGNGVARVFARDPTVFIFDLFNREIYPHDMEARRRIDCDVPVTTGYDDGRYLGALRRELPAFLDYFKGERKPRLAFYNAGTDILVGDPLGWMCVSARGVLERDRFVLEQLAEREIPCAMMTSGGYTRRSYELVVETAGWLVESSLMGRLSAKRDGG